MHRTLKTVAAIATIATIASSACYAADAANDAANAQYDAERARCMSGTTGQDQASCLRSAGAARDEVRQNRLHDPNTNYRDNALARCKALPAPDRADCEARVDSAGTGAGTASTTTKGSVKDGGVFKETVTTGIPVPPAQPK